MLSRVLIDETETIKAMAKAYYIDTCIEIMNMHEKRYAFSIWLAFQSENKAHHSDEKWNELPTACRLILFIRKSKS